ncbi:MAG TPA: FecR family protein [Planctomycetota bacterium]|nr:FecR family protein [Planctomycetota bacterium]
MKTPTCSEVEKNLWLYIDRELSASGVSSISSHLKVCDACRGLYHERARELTRYRLAFHDSPFGGKFVARCMRSLSRKGLVLDAPPTDTALQGSGFSLFARRNRRLLAVAALLLVVPTLVTLGLFVNRPLPRELGSFETDDDEGLVVCGRVDAAGNMIGRPNRVARGDWLPGSIIDVPERVSLFLRLVSPAGRESTIRLFGPAALALAPDATTSDFRATLRRGSLLASVTPRGAAQPFEIDTPHAVVKVVGTEFKLDVDVDRGTKLEVLHGTVQLRAREAFPSQGAKDVTLATGPYIVRGGDSQPVPASLEAQTPVPPAVTEVPAAPPEPGPPQGDGVLPPEPPATGTPDLDLDNPVNGRDYDE